jgi:hypothetical protein
LDLETKENRAKVAEDYALKVKTSVYNYYSWGLLEKWPIIIGD